MDQTLLPLTMRGQIARSLKEAPVTALRKTLRPRGPVLRNAPAPRAGISFAALVPPRAMVTIEALTDVVFAAQPDARAKVRTLAASPQTFNPTTNLGTSFVWVFTLQAEGTAWLPGHWERRRAGDNSTGQQPIFLNFQAAATAHEAQLPRPGSMPLTVMAALGTLNNPILAQSRHGGHHSRTHRGADPGDGWFFHGKRPPGPTRANHGRA